MKTFRNVLFALLITSGSLFANNLPPEAVVTITPGYTSFVNFEQIVFDGSGSYDRDESGNSITTYLWALAIGSGSYQLKSSGSLASSYSVCFESGGTAYATGASGCIQLGSNTTVKIRLQVYDDENSTDYFYTRDLTIRPPLKRRYFVKDHLGSVRATVDASGTVKGAEDYYPFGLSMPSRSINDANPNDNYKFTGHERDEEGFTGNKGIDHMNARTYDPITARFIQIDPILEYASPYTYVGNNPLNLVDPTGMFSQSDGYNTWFSESATYFDLKVRPGYFAGISSTHTDEQGNVIAVYDDGDLGVYRHTDATTREEIDKKREATGTTSGGGDKMGRTAFWDEFASHDNKTGRVLRNDDGSVNVLSNSKIHFGKQINTLVNDIYTVGDLSTSIIGLLRLAYQSLPRQQLDIKSGTLSANDGYMLNGVYVTGRSAGNYLAGRNASFAGQSWNSTIKAAGLVHMASANINPLSGFFPPTYGEIPSAARWIRIGHSTQW